MKDLTPTMIEKQHKTILRYYADKRKSETHDCKCWECRYFDEKLGCMKKAVER